MNPDENDITKTIVNQEANALQTVSTPLTEESRLDYFASTEDALAQQELSLVNAQVDTEGDTLKSRMQVTQTNNQNANTVYGATYANNQMTDKFGWTGGQLMDSETRVNIMKEQLNSDILTSSQYVEDQFKNDITKAREAIKANTMEIARQAVKDAQSHALARAELTGFYIDPVAEDVIGRYRSFKGLGQEIPDDVKQQLIAFGFGTDIGGVTVLDEKALDVMGTIMKTTTQAQMENSLRMALMDSGYELSEEGEIVPITEPATTPADVAVPPEMAKQFSDAGFVIDENNKITNFEAIGQDKYNAILKAAGKEIGTDGNIIDTPKWYTSDEGLSKQIDTNWNTLFNKNATSTKAANEYKAAKKRFMNSPLSSNRELIEILNTDPKSIKVTRIAKNAMNTYLGHDIGFEDKYTISYGDSKMIEVSGDQLLTASAIYNTKIGDSDPEIAKVYKYMSGLSGAFIRGNDNDGARRIFNDVFK